MKCFIKELNNVDFSDYLIRFDVIPIKLKLNDLIERSMLFSIAYNSSYGVL